MLGWTHKVNWSHWLRLKVLAFAAVSAAVFAGAASARPDEGTVRLSTASEIQQGAGGVTPTNLARAYEPSAAVLEQGAGGVTPTNLARAYVPRTIDEPALIRDVPDGVPSDVRRAVPTTSYVSDGGGSFDEGALALGFGLGLALSVVAGIVLMLTRGRMRLAHQ